MAGLNTMGVPLGIQGIGFIVLAIVSAYFFGAAPVLKVLMSLGLTVLGCVGAVVLCLWCFWCVINNKRKAAGAQGGNCAIV